MTRTVKKNHIRRAEILTIAGQLFQSKGYTLTSVDEIVRTIGVAKGTFYYYFKSKEEILDALVRQDSAKIAERAQAIADDPALGAVEKFCLILQNMKLHDDALIEGMHRPENRELHERSNIELIRTFGPILASAVEQGKQEGVFNVDDPLSTIQFILAGALLLLGHDSFGWTEEELANHNQATLVIIERALGAKDGVIVAALSASL